jgi:hypothetical protein
MRIVTQPRLAASTALLALSATLALADLGQEQSSATDRADEQRIEQVVHIERMVCRRERVTGSSIPQRVCRTERRIAEEQEAAQELIRNQRQTAVPAANP